MIKIFLIQALFLLCICNYTYAQTITYDCEFLVHSTPDGIKKDEKPFQLKYLIDRNSKKSYLIGNNGSSEVSEILNTDGVSFIEITNSGNVMVTAIANNNLAVHSRNGIFTNKLIPSQYNGKCDKK
jgi:hypothetical protein